MLQKETINKFRLPFIALGVIAVALLAVISLVTAASAPYGVDLGTDQQQETLPNTIVTFGNTVTNTGTMSDTIILQAISPSSWPVAISSSVYPTPTANLSVDLLPGASYAFSVTVDVAADTAGITENVQVVATSTGDSSVTTNINNTVQVNAYTMMLPVIYKKFPPVPGSLTLNPIDNSDGDPLYTVSWSIADLAVTYELEESTDPNFGTSTVVYQGSGTSWTTPSPRVPNVYYYRVRGLNTYGYGPYSNVESVVAVSFAADTNQLNAGQCTTLRWHFVNVQAVYVSFGKGYDKQGVNGVDSRMVCPSVTTTFLASVVYTDNSIGNFSYTVNVSNPNNICMDPYVNYFQSSTYVVSPNEKFTISWDVQCANTLHLVIGSGPMVPVTGIESRETSITQETLFKLVIQKSDLTTVNASFTVAMR